MYKNCRVEVLVRIGLTRIHFRNKHCNRPSNCQVSSGSCQIILKSVLRRCGDCKTSRESSTSPNVWATKCEQPKDCGFGIRNCGAEESEINLGISLSRLGVCYINLRDDGADVIICRSVWKCSKSEGGGFQRNVVTSKNTKCLRRNFKGYVPVHHSTQDQEKENRLHENRLHVACFGCFEWNMCRQFFKKFEREWCSARCFPSCSSYFDWQGSSGLIGL